MATKGKNKSFSKKSVRAKENDFEGHFNTPPFHDIMQGRACRRNYVGGKAKR